MRNTWIMILSLAAAAVLATSSLALAAKLICISKEDLKGQETVDYCLKKGERFVIIDDQGAVRSVNKEELELMRKVNPKIFEQPAYGIKYHHEAPEMPKLPPLAVPKLAH